MGKHIGYRLVARPEPDHTFWTACSISASVLLIKHRQFHMHLYDGQVTLRRS